MSPLDRHHRRQAKLRVLVEHKRAFRSGMVWGMAGMFAGRLIVDLVMLAVRGGAP